MRPAPGVGYAPPAIYGYRPYYSRWYVHPWYRWTYSTTVVVGFGFPCYAWTNTWIPPYRSGWTWYAGSYVGSAWWPGYWGPSTVAPIGYTYVPGYWSGSMYVDGWYRPNARTDGAWTWVDGYYLDDGTYVRGHWRPTRAGPQGYLWEPGFWDGQEWVEGFWRPEFRAGYTWVSAYYDEDGTFHTGYWAPLQQSPGQVWIPGWFDGTRWIEGYWVNEQEYESTDVQGWQPPEGWNDGWDVGGYGNGQVQPPADAQPLGLPVQP